MPFGDLDLPVWDYCRLPANEYVEAHGVVKSFVDLGGQNLSVNGQEWTRLPITRVSVYNLHSGR